LEHDSALMSAPIELPPDEHRLEPGRLPTPFSAAQIRESSAPGRAYKFRVEPPDEIPYVDRWEFISGDLETAERTRWTEELDGTVRGEPEVIRSTWVGFQSHASYPQERTTIATDSVITPAGVFDCWVYTLTNDDGSTTRASFAKGLPGPPVLLETAARGEVVFRMVLLETIEPG
jgi:hypothetical protein